MAAPNFFVVGAAKAGTTTLHNALGQHPDVFMTRCKEPGFFSPDVSWPTQWNGDLDTYLRLFRGTEEFAVRGESSPSYLYSTLAASKIREFAPTARIVIVLRNPVESIVSCYAEARKWGVEPKGTLEAAVRASDRERRATLRPGGMWIRYRDVVRYAPQVERYVAAFPREQLHISRYDDLVTDPSGFLRAVFGFLGVADVDVPVGRDNPRYSYRSAAVQRMVMRRYARARDNERAHRVRDRVRERALRLNLSDQPVTVPRSLRATLTAELRPDVERLAEITGLDLSAWLRPPALAGSLSPRER
jgi:hypothetical protein